MPRFVILQHDGFRSRHWDLMLEAGATLRTWALAEAPEPGKSILAEPLKNHRAEYLTYEGPVSGGRGVVARWDHGHYDVLTESDAEIRLRLAGRRLAVVATLSRRDAGAWEFFLDAP